MDNLKPPTELSMDGDVAVNFAKWKQQFEIYMTASGFEENNSISAERKVAILLHSIGPEAQEVYQTLTITADDRKDWKKVVQHFEHHFKPKENETINRHLFHTRRQKEGESIDVFVTDLKKLSANCNFGELRDSLIRDRIVCGILDHKVRDSLLQKATLSLTDCINSCKGAELAGIMSKKLENDGSGSSAVHAVRKEKIRYPQSTNKQHKHSTDSRRKVRQEGGEEEKGRRCQSCGSRHMDKKCPAYRKMCRNCGNYNHFAKMCPKLNRRVHVIETDSSGDERKEDLFIGMVTDVKYVSSISEWTQKVIISGKEVKCKVDTGADVNILTKKCAQNLHIRLVPSQAKLKSYNGTEINVLGKATVTCQIKDQKEEEEFQVVDYDAPCIIGLPFIKKFDLLRKVEVVTSADNNDLLKEYKFLFEGIGELKNSYRIKLKENCEPVSQPPRKIPISLQKKVKEELDKMEKMNIIKKITEPTEWCSSLVTVKKPDGTLRLCLDPQHLNQAIVRERYQLPTFEELASRMAGASVFSILDGNKGFYQIKLAEESQLLTTFHAGSFGRYAYKRVPYGICSAPEMFHRKFKEVFEGLDGVEVYIDDVIVWGKDEDQHQERLKAVLERARKCNVRFNRKKCKFALSEVKYVGHIFSKDGLKPDQEKIRAILEMEEPKDKKELQTILGMATYVSKFIPKLSDVTYSMRQLLKNNVEFNWTANHRFDFLQLKEMLTKTPVLQFYDENKDVVISVDSSSRGLGAVILQDDLPVAYASKALTPTQQSWAQIEKELLAIVHGCERFHQYCYGKTVIVESDHKPLESILRKPLVDTPLRLQRLRLRLQPYDIIVKYKPGKDLLLADCLSRSYLKSDKDHYLTEIEEEVNVHTCFLVNNLPLAENKRDLFKKETSSDTDLSTVIKYIQTEWPDFEKIPDHLKFFASIKNELFTVDGLLFKNNSIVVPKSLRKEMLKLIHISHLGIEKCKLRAKNILFWPHIWKEIEDVVRNCQTCAKFQKTHSYEELLLREVPDKPWEVVGVDLFYMNNKVFLLLVDYFSKFIEFVELQSETAEKTILALKSVFARYGKPRLVYTDEGVQFKSHKFKEFCKNWQFQHSMSSPYYPRSNGMVERHVKVCKSLIQKAFNAGIDPYIALIEYRNTPIDGKINKSPAELVFGRPVNAFLPTPEDFKITNEYNDVKETLQERQELFKKYHDKRHHAKPQEFAKGEVVHVKDPVHKMVTGKIEGPSERPRAYKVKLPSGNTVERNRLNIYKASPVQKFKIESDVELDSEIQDKENKNNKPTVSERNLTCVPTPTLSKSQEQKIIASRYGRQVNKPKYLSEYILE